jgi:hypothetical protein
VFLHTSKIQKPLIGYATLTCTPQESKGSVWELSTPLERSLPQFHRFKVYFTILYHTVPIMGTGTVRAQCTSLSTSYCSPCELCRELCSSLKFASSALRFVRLFSNGTKPRRVGIASVVTYANASTTCSSEHSTWFMELLIWPREHSTWHTEHSMEHIRYVSSGKIQHGLGSIQHGLGNIRHGLGIIRSAQVCDMTSSLPRSLPSACALALGDQSTWLWEHSAWLREHSTWLREYSTWLWEYSTRLREQ